MGAILSSVAERYPLYRGVIFHHTVFWDENICPLLEAVRCIEVPVNGGSIVSKLPLFINLKGQFLKQKWPVFYFKSLGGGIAPSASPLPKSLGLVATKAWGLSQFASFGEITT